MFCKANIHINSCMTKIQKRFMGGGATCNPQALDIPCFWCWILHTVWCNQMGTVGKLTLFVIILKNFHLSVFVSRKSYFLLRTCPDALFISKGLWKRSVFELFRSDCFTLYDFWRQNYAEFFFNDLNIKIRFPPGQVLRIAKLYWI